jgi:hypothetical protein
LVTCQKPRSIILTISTVQYDDRSIIRKRRNNPTNPTTYSTLPYSTVQYSTVLFDGRRPARNSRYETDCHATFDHTLIPSPGYKLNAKLPNPKIKSKSKMQNSSGARCMTVVVVCGKREQECFFRWGWRFLVGVVSVAL